MGYRRVPSIDQEGSWSRRGDIIDIYPVSNELPIRLEFFGEELDKLREFDPVTQRSLDDISKLCLTPTSFNPLIAEKLREDIPPYIEIVLSTDLIDELLEGNTPEGLRRLMGYAWMKPSCLLDYIQKIH